MKPEESLRRLLHIYFEQKTNDWVQSKINFLVSPQKSLLATVKRQTLAWFRHATRHDSLSINHPSGHLGERATL